MPDDFTIEEGEALTDEAIRAWAALLLDLDEETTPPADAPAARGST